MSQLVQHRDRDVVNAPGARGSSPAALTDGELLADVRRHLEETQLAWALRGNGRDLLIPGHAPVAFESEADDEIFSGIESFKFYEEVTTLVLAYLLERFSVSVFYDIGADKGYFSRVAAAFGGSAMNVHAFEMRPEAAIRLRCIVEDDPMLRSVMVHNTGLTSEHHGETLIWYARTKMFELRPTRREYREGLAREFRRAIWPRTERALKAAKVELTSIDAFAKRSGDVPDVIKIDVEGYEPAVLAGAYATMSRSRPFILLELHKDKKMRLGISRQEVVELALRRGYKALFFTDHESREDCEVVPVNLDHPLIARQQTDLLLLYHPQRLGSLRCTR